MTEYKHLFTTLEEDIPEIFWETFSQQILAIENSQLEAKEFLMGLDSLHKNQHQDALKLFLSSSQHYPQFIGPKLYFILTSIESNVLDETEMGYWRDFFLYQLSFVSSPYIESFLLAYDGLKMIWNKQKLNGIENCKKAEVFAGDFYPTLYIIARAYNAVGDRKTFDKYYQKLEKICPRIKPVSREIFRGSLN